MWLRVKQTVAVVQRTCWIDVTHVIHANHENYDINGNFWEFERIIMN